jgi:hypothetical protein
MNPLAERIDYAPTFVRAAVAVDRVTVIANLVVLVGLCDLRLGASGESKSCLPHKCEYDNWSSYAAGCTTSA